MFDSDQIPGIIADYLLCLQWQVQFHAMPIKYKTSKFVEFISPAKVTDQFTVFFKFHKIWFIGDTVMAELVYFKSIQGP